MKLYFLFVLIMGLCITCSAQVIPNYRTPTKTPDIFEVFSSKVKKHGYYKRNVQKYIYEIEMKDGSVLKANSEILRDSISGKYFIYYLNSESLRKIFPEETITIKKPNPYNTEESIVGIPYGKSWQFKVLEGSINAYCYFINGKQINEIQVNGGDIISFSPEILKPIIKNTNKANDAFDKKDYYTAIKIYNKRKAINNKRT